MCLQVELWEDVLDDEVTAVLDLIRICELYVEFVATFRYQGQRDQLGDLIELSEPAVQKKLYRPIRFGFKIFILGEPV